MANLFLHFYKNLLGTAPPMVEMVGLDDMFPNQIFYEHRSCIVCPVTMDELERVIFFIRDDKAPRLDDFSGKFFKVSWDIVG